MDDTERMLIERACERLVTAYCHYIDHGEAVQVAELFTEDGVWARPEARMEGRDGLEKGFLARQNRTDRTSRHVCQNFLCDVVDENNASGVVYLTLDRHDGETRSGVAPAAAPAAIGEYRDRFVRTDDGWRIAERRVWVDFSSV